MYVLGMQRYPVEDAMQIEFKISNQENSIFYRVFARREATDSVAK